MIDAYKEMYGKLPMQFQLESYEESKLGDYICDTVDDLKDLPEDVWLGYCIQTQIIICHY